MRGRSFDASGLGTLQVTSSEDQASVTIKQQPSKFPTSLRHLFDVDVTSAPDPFRIPGFSAASRDAVSSLPGSPVAPPSPATPVVRDRAARRALRVENNIEDGPNLSTATFAFPPRTITRATKAKVGAGSPPSDDQINSTSPNPAHADKLPGSSLAETTVTGSNIPVPVSQGSGLEAKLTAFNDDGPIADARLVPALSRRSPASRNRSQSTAQGLPPTPVLEQNPPLPSDFHFPQHSLPSDPNQSTPSGPGSRPRARISPTRTNTSNTQVSLHNPAHSFDARISTGYHMRPSPPSFSPAVLGRSRSATPADDITQDSHAGPSPSGLKPQQRPSLHRLASLTVIETPSGASSTKTIPKPMRGRSGNSAGGVGDLSGIPDLKDVLKVNLPHSVFFTLTNFVLSLPHLPRNTNSG